MNPLAKVADPCRQLLTEQQIFTSGPGTILSDTQTVIEFIGTGGLLTKSKQGNLPSAVLPALNARLSQPIELSLNRPLLRDFPNIAGLYVLLRVMNLAQADERRLRINAQTLAVWSGLNPTESEISLGETGLPEKQIMKFRFDFGDDWPFVLRLERIDPPDKKMKHCELIDSVGKAPKQYPDWD